MTAPPSRVLIALDEVSDLLVLRRLLRDTPHVVETVRSGEQAVAALAAKDYAAVITDDERLPDASGAALLDEAARLRPAALRVLLARPERSGALADGARAGSYQLIERPFFAQPLLATLQRHAAEQAAGAASDVTQRTAAPTAPTVEMPTAAGEPAERAAPAPGRIAHRRILLTLAELAEAKAGYSAGHGARVSALAGVLGREAGLDGEALDALEDAALVHDVGELAIDPKVLQQKRQLTAVEQSAVQRHVESSFQVVRRAGLGALVAAVRHHHEHCDGSGYPDRLSGDAIPLAARIIAVADTWDALATDRPYRPAAAPADCVRTLEALAPAQLDAGLVALFVGARLYDLIDWSDPPRPGIKLL